MYEGEMAAVAEGAIAVGGREREVTETLITKDFGLRPRLQP